MAAAAGAVDAALHGVPGVLALVEHHELVAAITSRLDQLDAYAADVDAELGGVTDADELERASAASIALRDVLWALRRDRLRTVREVADLAGRGAGPAALAGYLAIQQAFSTIDRMEVRGRDSAGIHVFVWDHDLDVDRSGAHGDARRAEPRSAVPERRGALRRPGPVHRLQGGGGDR